MAVPLVRTSAGESNVNLTTNWAIREIENWLVGPWTKVRRKAGRSRRWTPPARIAHRRWAKSGLQAVAQVPDNGTSDSDGESGPRQCQTVMPSLARPPAAGLGSHSVLAAIPEVYYMAYMNHRHGLIRQSVLGLQTLTNIVFAMALIMSQPSWAATSPVTIGGPFTLIAPDGTTVTDQTFRGKWLLVYFGYTFCPNTCPITLNEIATALEKLDADAAKMQALFITVDPHRDTR